MTDIKEIMNKMDDQQLKQFLDDATIITDDLGKTLLSKIAGPHSPLAVDDLPLQGFTKSATLARLYEFEDVEILKSKMEKKGTGYVRIFYATDIAKRIADQISRHKS